jgi:hypothetical protein
MFWKTPVVFEGEVESIERLPNRQGPQYMPERVVTFRVSAAHRGSVGTKVEVRTGGSSASCGFPFEEGERYLVYAHQGAGGLATGICSRTRRLVDAADDLAYIRSAFAPAATGRVYGDVAREVTEPGVRPRGASGYSVILAGFGEELRVTTDHDGRFEFPSILPGTYSIRVDLPDTEFAYGGPRLLVSRDIIVPDARGCATASFTVVPNGRLAATVLDANGRPVERAEVSVALSNSPDRSETSARTDAAGQVLLGPLRPGRYLVGINVRRAPNEELPYPRSFHPGVVDVRRATVIELGYGERHELDPFVLPVPLAARRLTGIVVWPDGRPAGDTHITLVGADTSWVVASTRTAADGTFSLTAYDRQTYRVSASHSTPGPQRVTSQARADAVHVQGDTGPIRLVLTTIRR